MEYSKRSIIITHMSDHRSLPYFIARHEVVFDGLLSVMVPGGENGALVICTASFRPLHMRQRQPLDSDRCI